MTLRGSVADSATNDAANILRHLLEHRYSCRAFQSEPVPRKTIRAILEMAQRTASWCNTQPWQTIITSGAATDRFRAALAKHAATHQPAPDIGFPRSYSGEYSARRAEAARQLFESVSASTRAAVARQVAQNFVFFGAPHLLIVTSPEELGTYGAVDCGGWISSFMLAVRSYGLGCIAQASLAGQAPFVREYFRIASDRLILCGIAFGYEAPAHAANSFRTMRADVDTVVTWIDA